MRGIVRDYWKRFNSPFEGVVKFMYLDVEGYVTIGMGNLIDPIGAARDLPFQKRIKAGVANPGSRATREEIEAEWTLIKTHTELAKLGHRKADPLCTLELSDATIDDLIRAKLTANEMYLKRAKAFANFELWPADAQMALLSMAWAMGPGFAPRWPKFSAACEAMDFEAAARNCRMKEAGNPGLVPRNNANQTLFMNAAAVLAGASENFFDANSLYYPTILLKPVYIVGDGS